jgi:hypothetical protein
MKHFRTESYAYVVKQTLESLGVDILAVQPGRGAHVHFIVKKSEWLHPRKVMSSTTKITGLKNKDNTISEVRRLIRETDDAALHTEPERTD